MTPNEALVRSLHDSRNTNRPDEAPETMPALIKEAETIMFWLDRFGFEIRRKP